MLSSVSPSTGPSLPVSPQGLEVQGRFPMSGGSGWPIVISEEGELRGGQANILAGGRQVATRSQAERIPPSHCSLHCKSSNKNARDFCLEAVPSCLLLLLGFSAGSESAPLFPGLCSIRQEPWASLLLLLPGLLPSVEGTCQSPHHSPASPPLLPPLLCSGRTSSHHLAPGGRGAR